MGIHKAFNSQAVSEGCSYRRVLSNIVKVAEGVLKKKYPELTREERIIKAQTEPYFTRCKEDRDLTKE